MCCLNVNDAAEPQSRETRGFYVAVSIFHVAWQSVWFAVCIMEDLLLQIVKEAQNAKLQNVRKAAQEAYGECLVNF